MAIHQLFAQGRLQCAGASEDDIARLQPPRVDDIPALLAQLRQAQAALRAVPVDHLIGWLDAAAADWSRRDHSLHAQLGTAGLPFLLHWLKRAHLETMLDLALRGNRHVLDQFQSLDRAAPTQRYRAQPRGLAVHWLAGNVPLLGWLSFVQGLLTKNANVLKVPSRGSLAIPKLLEALGGVTYRAPQGQLVRGAELLQSVAAVYVAHDDHDAHRALSSAADVRVAWGSREAMEAILPLPKASHAEDIIFGPKYSYIVIGREAMADAAQAAALAQRVALDASLFDQYGCSSPHTVCLEEGGAVSPRAFAQLLAEAMAQCLARVPRRGVTPAEASAIVGARAEYTLRGEVLAPSTTEWTVILAPNLDGLAPPCHGRVVFIRPMPDVLVAAEDASRLTQTIGVALGPERRAVFAERATARGADRCPAIGEMHLYDLPWDGMFVVDRLVRWATLTTKESP